MDERIKELAIEAGGGPSKWYTNPDVLEYFTELVVKECVEVAFCNFHVSGGDLGELMKKHFGFE